MLEISMLWNSCRRRPKGRCHVKPIRQARRRVQARDRRLHNLDGQADNAMLLRARPQLENRRQMGPGPPPRARGRARSEGRGPRAARGEEAHTRARDGERLLEKKPRPSSPKSRGSRALPADAGGEGRIPDRDDGENPRREQVRILLVAGRRLPRRRLVGRARGREARLAGVGPQVRREVREYPGENASNEWCEPVTDEEYAAL